MKTEKKLLLKSALLLFSILTLGQGALAQCTGLNWTTSIGCGTILANGGLSQGSPVFCEGVPVVFQNNTSSIYNIQTIYLDWGDGICEQYPANVPTFTHNYNFPDDTCVMPSGSIGLQLRMGAEKTCDNGQKRSFHSITTDIIILFKPVAKFTASDYVVCINDPINFTNLSCENTENPTYLWNFGDGNTSTLESPSHTYAAAGTYNVMLTVTQPPAPDGCGQDTYSQSISVTQPATAAATASATPICAGGIVSFTNQSTNAAIFNPYTWTVTPSAGVTFVNNTTFHSPNPSIRFTIPGTYTIKLEVNGCGSPKWMVDIEVLAPPAVNIVTIPDNCAATAVTINPTANLGGTGTTVTWQFPGGNPTTGSGANPGPVTYSGQGTYIVIATTSTSICGMSVDMDTFSIAPAATAAFTIPSSSICGPDSIVTVTNTSTNGDNHYKWTVSPNSGFTYVGGSSDTSAQPKYKFTVEGNYTITLKINACGSPTANAMVHVRLRPTATLMATPDTCQQTITFSPASLTTFSGGAADNTTWTFLNGTPSTFSGPNPPPVTFTGFGSHGITVTVGNECGMQTVTDTFQILAPATAAATIADDSLCAPAELLIVSTNTSTFASSYHWSLTPATGNSFVSGTSASSALPQLEFMQEGLYTLTLNVNGCGHPTWDTVVHVLLTPIVSLTPEVPTGCVDVTLQPLDYGHISGGVAQSIFWTFGGGSPATATGLSPGPVNFSGYGQHFISLMAQNACGLVSAVDSFEILEPATIALTPAGPFCNSVAPVQLQATPLSSDGWSGIGITPGGLFDPGQVPDNLLNSYIPLYYQYGSASCLVKDTLLVLVQGTAVNLGDDRGLCANSAALTLPASPNGGLWSGDSVTVSGYFNPVTAGNGPHTLIYTFEDMTTHCINTDTIVLTVLGPPAAALDSIGNICVGEEKDFGPFSGGTDIVNCFWDFGDNATSNQCDPLHTYTMSGNYTLIFYVENTAGCKDTASVELQIVTPPNAVFSIDTSEGCADLPINISNQSALNDYTLYIWDYGDGRRDTLPQPGTITFYQGEHDTTYTIILKAVNQCGEATDQDSVTVFPRPQVRFGSDVSSGCTPLEVNFNNVSVGEPDFFQWYINGVVVDTQFQLPQQVFLTTDHDSTYYIMLIAGNECGLDTIIHTVLVKPNPVLAFFNTDTLIGCQPFTVRLIDYSTQGLYISWDLGDNNFATGDTVVHTFPLVGQYLIQEFVNNGCGFDTAEVTITVLPLPEVSFTHLPFVCVGDTLFLQNTSPNLVGSYWDFGDGTGDSTHTSPGHIYTQAGNYVLTLRGLAITTGCPNTVSSTVEVRALPVPMVTLPDTFGCQPFVFKPHNGTAGTNFYVWDFGNNVTSTEAEPIYIYPQPGAYTVGLQVTDLFGCKNTWSYTPLNVFPKPIANYSYDQAELCVTPALVQFQNQSIDADTYRWDFGPLGISNEENPVLTVNNPITLPVTLYAESQYHCRDTIMGEIKVYTKPMLDFEPQPDKGCEPLLILFENSSMGVNQYAWHFGDGATDNISSPHHIFEHAGQYSVTLFASADSLCFDSLTFTNLITVLPSPTAAFTYEAVNDTTVQPNGIFRFFDASLNAVRWHWDFGDGDTSVQQNPVHRYYLNGPKVVTLIVFNNTGCSDTLVQIIKPENFGGLFIPNALSPEAGDAGSREFLPVGEGLIEFEISIFASNGERVWYSNHLTDGRPDEAWDGTYKGKLLPQGLYWWKARARFYSGRLWAGMKYEDKDAVTEGKVLLIR